MNRHFTIFVICVKPSLAVPPNLNLVFCSYFLDLILSTNILMPHFGV